MTDILDLGAARLDATTNVLLVQAKTTQIGADPDDAPDLGEIPFFGALGVTALPAPANENGHAQAIKLEAPGTNGVAGPARDTRVAEVIAQMSAGETCLHSTGEGFDSRAFCKDQLFSIVVGNDMVINVDRKNKKISLSAFGGHIEVGDDGGCYMAHGGALIQVKDGVIVLTGQVVLGGQNPVQPLLMGPSGTAGVPVPGVFAGA